MKDRLRQQDCIEQGWLLDGFPRTSAQAAALQEAGIHADGFLFVNVPDHILVERVVGRRTDPITGKIYHMTFSPPTDEDVRARLVQQSDDTEAMIKVRLQQFHSNIRAVRDRFADIMVVIDGNKAPGEISQDIEAAIREKLQKKLTKSLLDCVTPRPLLEHVEEPQVAVS